LVEYRGEIENYWGCTVEELIQFKEGFQVALQGRLDTEFLKKKALAVRRRKSGLTPEYTTLYTLEDE
jgi:hypothetical protein